MEDRYGRTIDYMRISITDRCNLRCRYCMPDGISLVSMREILTFEEIETICHAAVELGIRKFKITGGEPLVRKGATELVGKIKRIPGVEQVTLTTNGVLLKAQLESLIENGLDAVNISLDTLDSAVYREITGRDELQAVFEGMEAAVTSNLRVKLNCVLQQDTNEAGWSDLVRLAEKWPLDVRFIEMMPIGLGKQYPTISNVELLERIKNDYPQLRKDFRIHGNGPAVYYRIPGFRGSIGFISAVHGKFCDRCNRIRLSTQGELKFCLCYEDSIDLREILRDHRTGEDARDRKEALQAAIRNGILQKPKAHCFDREDRITESRNMIQIGG